ncbi:MAG TPA: purine nucleoside permease [Acidobacteriaceae bacterium]|jgi:purine nucleoside permease|nr:purine nucleoside permease [Acidobacteriaceae bacterium]
MRRFASLLAVCSCLCFTVLARAQGDAVHPVEVKVVIVTTFEVGEDTGDRPGEFQYWVEREHLDRRLPFPGGMRDLRANADESVIGVVTGMTIGPAASTIMVLGLDPRFDLTHAYWLLAGIAGVDPNAASLGSAAWAKWIVSDIRQEIDPREAPPDWPYGILAIGAMRPNETPDPKRMWGNEPIAYPLNPTLADWAFHLTEKTPLMDTPEVAALRATWTGFPNAQRLPFVLEGDTLGSDAYWHGQILTHYAEDWIRIHTHEQGRFVMTDMEDPGIAEALTRLDKMHRADFRRFLVLRTASNFSMQGPGHGAADSLTAPYVGGIPALENAWRVGSPVVREILANWAQYRDSTPGYLPLTGR